MTDLYILRHGIAFPHSTPDIPDDERPLTPVGEKRMVRIARGLVALGLKLDKIVSSPLPRAWRTAEIVAEALDLSKQLEAADVLRAGVDATAIRDWLRTRTEPRLMIVGHNPAFSDLIGLMITGEPTPLCELRKGGVAALSATDGSGLKLDWLARPRLLKRLGGD